MVKFISIFFILSSLVISEKTFGLDLEVKAIEQKPSGFWSNLASPITTDAVWITAFGTLATGMLYVTKKDNTYHQRQSFSDAKPLGNIGFIGDFVGYGLLNVSYLGYFYGQYLWGDKDQETLKKVNHMFQATLYSVGVTNLLKFTIKEKRPGYPDDEHSFPSGHSSASFAFASVVAAQHGWVYGGLAHTLAYFISTSRINDDFHYLHDVAFGITIGASYAWGIYYQMERESPYWFTLIPTSRSGIGMALGYQF
jgi:membrane-associated phospholipid phosphatase